MQAGIESFFELIAIDPDAPDPLRAHWFTLNFPVTKAKVDLRPFTLCWVLSADNLDDLVASSGVPLGEIVTFVRGDRSWRLTVPKDGHLPEDGLLPTFIEWSPAPHPSTAHQKLGVTLKRIRLSHPDPQGLLAKLVNLGVDHLAEVTMGAVGLSFAPDTPNGRVIID